MDARCLPRIIDSSMAHRRKLGHDPNWGTVIRGTLQDIEQKLRFDYVRAMSCYVSVLRQVLVEAKRSDALPSIPSISLYLEVGASSQTMMSFMGLGLSRFTAARLQSLLPRTNLAPSDARRWLRSHDPETLDIPFASANEIRKLGLTS